MKFEYNRGNRPYWLQFLFDGKYFLSSHKYTVLKNNGVAYYQFKTGELVGSSKRLVHIVSRNYVVEGGGPIVVEIFEGLFDTLTDGTIPANVFSNLDRRGGQDSVATIYVNPTNITGGTLFDQELIATGGGPKASGSFVSGVTERVLNYNTDYIIKFTNQSLTEDAILQQKILWYESGE